jgi:DNA-binding beta-propeller fold protein YncE
MRRSVGTRHAWLGALCAVTALCAATVALGIAAAPAQAASSDPLFLYVPVQSPPKAPFEAYEPPPGPPPTGSLNGPCGLAVDSTGDFYLSDYYHDGIDFFSTFKDKPGTLRPSYKGQLTKTAHPQLDGPCGLAFDAADNLYVNNYHRNVVKFSPALSFETSTVIDSSDPTGVAVDPASGNVYVDDRTHVAVYDSAGAPVLDGEGDPLQIGLGSLGDGYGVAYSRYSGTLGYVYVPDAADDTVKVYDPAVDTADPIATIDGHETLNGAFVSLRDSAIAVDRVSGEIYVADNFQPFYAEQPQTAIYVFSALGKYEGHLKYNVSDPRPPGLAVDNSTFGNQGRVYVTSGNTAEAGVYGYPPGAVTTPLPLPGWPVGGCQGIPTCAETTGGSSTFGAGLKPAGSSLTASVEASSLAPAAAGAALEAPAPRRRRIHRRRGTAHRRRATHRRHGSERPRQGGSGAKRGGR